ncbi:hypothetical protein MAUB_35410 [Mycolicibacterium aubagnense]|uniref:Uncharacterized protein n=2 Tax=Mycolicibacterium aubagnense TaxID=319707 RepID=A0ABN5YV26_9MYCO|nr:hypothetical protein MAUB_35410 [Mycolicibacterium aubagnense]
MDMTDRREAITLVIGAFMLAAAAMLATEAQERAQNLPAVSISEHHSPAEIVDVAPPVN